MDLTFILTCARNRSFKRIPETSTLLLTLHLLVSKTGRRFYIDKVVDIIYNDQAIGLDDRGSAPGKGKDFFFESPIR
jgi:hypothetical protein